MHFAGFSFAQVCSVLTISSLQLTQPSSCPAWALALSSRPPPVVPAKSSFPPFHPPQAHQTHQPRIGSTGPPLQQITTPSRCPWPVPHRSEYPRCLPFVGIRIALPGQAMGGRHLLSGSVMCLYSFASHSIGLFDLASPYFSSNIPPPISNFCIYRYVTLIRSFFSQIHNFKMQYSFVAAAVLAFTSSVFAQTAGFAVMTVPSQDQNVEAGSTLDITWAPSTTNTGAITIQLLQGASPSTLEIGETIAGLCARFSLVVANIPNNHFSKHRSDHRKVCLDCPQGSQELRDLRIQDYSRLHQVQPQPSLPIQFPIPHHWIERLLLSLCLCHWRNHHRSPLHWNWIHC